MISCAMLAGTLWALAPPRKLDWTRLKGWNASGQTLFFFYLSYQIFFFFFFYFWLSFLFILFKTQPPALQKSWLTAACNHVDVESIWLNVFNIEWGYFVENVSYDMSNMDNFVSIQISYRKIWLIGRPRENLSYDIGNINNFVSIQISYRKIWLIRSPSTLQYLVYLNRNMKNKRCWSKSNPFFFLNLKCACNCFLQNNDTWHVHEKKLCKLIEVLPTWRFACLWLTLWNENYIWVVIVLLSLLMHNVEVTSHL